jgi:hypothetical protein
MLMYSEHFKRLWIKYRGMRNAHELYKSEQEKAFVEMKRAEEELVNAMLDSGSTNFEIDGMRPYLSADRSCSVNQDNVAEVEQWLEVQRGGAESFKRLIIDPWAVKRLVREEIKDGADPSSYPEFLKVAVRPRLNVRGWIGSSDKEGGDDEQ